MSPGSLKDSRIPGPGQRRAPLTILRPERGQSTPEWIGLIFLICLALAGIAAAGVHLPGTSLVRSIATRIICAVQLSDSCRSTPALAEAYGSEIAELVREHAPSLAYERGMSALPVDFRDCESPGCSDGPGAGQVTSSRRGEPVSAFVRVIDCRAGEDPGPGVDCGSGREGRTYLQYWLYYPDSASMRGVPIAEDLGYHLHDWEGFQVRVDSDGRAGVRASSHHGYNHTKSMTNWPVDAGIPEGRDLLETVGLRNEGGWGRETGWYFISGGSHAGNAEIDDGNPGNAESVGSYTPSDRIRLIPLEPLVEQGGLPSFGGISPPWEKKVWTDPEVEGTS